MDERTEAIRILQQTREALARRLTERILESREEILAEAEGESFLSEIETIYDQLGLKLAHVNQMLTHLPAAPSPASAEDKPAAWPASRATPAAACEPSAPSQPVASARCAISSLLALPAPNESNAPLGGLASSALLMFALHARRGEVEAGAVALESLFGLQRERALACARVFHSHCRRDPAYVENAALLHNYLQADALSRAFGLMCESLGLAGGEALSALLWWRARTAR